MTNEITEASLKNRLKLALIAHHGLTTEVKAGGTVAGIDKEVNDAYAAGKFSEIVGVVKIATDVERERAAGVARRLGHAQTAQVIRNGGSDV